MTISDYFGKWLKVIDIQELQNVLNKLNTVDKTILCPEYKNIFKAFSLCKYENCKVVFLGMDPYPQKGVATGLLFGNKPNTIKLSPSLEVIKEACINYEVYHNPLYFDITLESWAKQGILLLNSALTCEINKVGSHINIWRKFISLFLHNLSSTERNIIFVLFGSQAKSFKPYIDTTYNTIFEVEHPAYLSRVNQKLPYSLFTDINKILKSIYNTTIMWYKYL